MSLNWVTITPLSGTSGTTTIQVTVGRNTGDTRNGSITFSGATLGNIASLAIRQKEFSYTTEPLTFEIVSGGTVLWTVNDENYATPVSYSINGGAWNTITPTTAGTAINVSTGDKVQFMNDISSYGSANYFHSFGGTAKFNVYGNIMSLTSGGAYASATALTGTYNFRDLFSDSNVIDASNLVLPAITATESCYRYMFSHCISLTSTPKLPATTVNAYSYQGMFQGCTALTTTAEMSATTFNGSNGCYRMYQQCSGLTTIKPITANTIGTYCFYQMFDQCTSLVIAPELPATSLSTHCYDRMFTNCTNLVSGPSTLPAATLYVSCYYRMFENCISLVNAPQLPSKTLVGYCYDLMFSGCTSLTTAPELPAKTVAQFAYYRMFDGCSSLNYIKCMAEDISASDSVTNWVRGVAPTGTFVKSKSMSGWTIDSNSGIPIGWTIQEETDYESEPLTFEIVSGGTIVLYNPSAGWTFDVEYNVNDCVWNTVTLYSNQDSGQGQNTYSINVSAGDVVCVKARNSLEFLKFQNSTATFNLSGNLKSLNYNSVVPDNCYGFMFQNTNVISAENLIIPYITSYCCENMFYNCTSLTTAPVLSATTLAYGCYYSMFNGCTSLTTAPVLPAATLASNCYAGMFAGCSNLNYVKCLATDWEYDGALDNWLSGVSYTGTFVKSAGVSWPSELIPSGWTIQDA